MNFGEINEKSFQRSNKMTALQTVFLLCLTGGTMHLVTAGKNYGIGPRSAQFNEVDNAFTRMVNYPAYVHFSRVFPSDPDQLVRDFNQLRSNLNGSNMEFAVSFLSEVSVCYKLS